MSNQMTEVENSFSNSSHLTRRELLKTTATGFMAGSLIRQIENSLIANETTENRRRPKVANVFTVFHYLSHTYHILHPFTGPYLFNGKLLQPQCDVVSFYGDQFHDNDMAKNVAAKYQIPIYKTISEALCEGGKELAVDAVLSIGEHGKYPENKRHQTEYPRKRFFDEIVAVMKRSKRFVPLFSDKHLSYRWDWAKEMYETSRKYQFPLMAGSSVPLAQRIPNLEIPAGTEMEEAISVHGGPLEKYDIHGLEVLQSMVEFRKGGETGLSSVQFLKGDELMKAGKQGRWSIKLAEKAMRVELGANHKKRNLFGIIGDECPIEPHGILLEYKDGFRATVLRIGENGTRWNFAYQKRGAAKPEGTLFFPGPWGNRNLFRAFSNAIQYLFVEKKEPYPVERALLTTGVLDAAMSSLVAGGKKIKTPHLNIRYQPTNFNRFREMGDSWKIITKEMTPPENYIEADPNGG